jgi:hypothetical protein
MQQFIEKYGDRMVGVLSGFDRLVLRGSPRRLDISYWDPARQVMVAKGMEEFLWQNGVLFKHYGDYLKKTSERVKKASTRAFSEAGLPVIYLREAGVDKDEYARRVAAERGIRTGPVCVLSVLEPCPTFEYVQSKIVRRKRPCHVLYHYGWDERLGWMYARIQTWFPFHIQIGINGREWLAQQMRQAGLAFQQEKNCFTRIADFQRAQELLNRQLQTDWVDLLTGFAQRLNPIHIAHGLLSYHSHDVLRFFGKRTTKAGHSAIPRNFHGELQTSCKQYEEGERIKFWMDGNSAKAYSKLILTDAAVLRAAETTINNVGVFRTYRPAEGGPDDDLQWRKMRKGIADLHRRAEVSQQTNNRLIDALASVDDSRRLEELIADIQKPVNWQGRRVRALRPLGDDGPLLEAINHGDFLLNGFRNRDLQALLYDTPAHSAAEKLRRSAAISRRLRMLRAHGLIRKVPHTHRYHVSPNARTLLVAILTAARTTLNQVNQLRSACASSV